MKTSIRIAALLLGGALFVGCSKGDNTASTTPPANPSTVTPPATPATPDVSKSAAAINAAVDKGAAGVKAETDKLISNAPTTMPSMPK